MPSAIQQPLHTPNIRGTYSHRQQVRSIMAHLEILIGEAFRAVDRRRSRAITVEEITALNHEFFDHTVEPAAFVTLRSSQMVPRFARAILTKVFCCQGDDVGEKLHFDTTERLATEGDVEEDNWIRGGGHFCLGLVLGIESTVEKY